MKTILMAVLLSQSLLPAANAAIVCEGQTRFGGSLQLTINDDHSAHIAVVNEEGTTELAQTFQTLDNVWDGHMTGLITAAGLSVKYENQYGCIRHVVITTNVRGGATGYIDTVKVAACRGGTTRDALCLGH